MNSFFPLEISLRYNRRNRWQGNKEDSTNRAVHETRDKKWHKEKKRMRKIGIFLIVGFFACGLVSAARGAEAIKLGYVDMQKALNVCEAGKEAKKQITDEVGKLEKTFVGKQKDLEKLKDELEKKGMVLSESARREKEKDYQAKLRDLQRMQRDSEEDLRRKDQEYTGKILAELAGIARKLGEEGKYSVIFERNQPAFVYISNMIDLTDDVIKIADQNFKKK
jgi:outer membrane protein